MKEEGLSVDEALVGAARVSEDARDAGFVHLYVKRGLRAERVSGGGWPGVIAEVQVQGEVVKIVAAHLVHGPGAGAARLRQARRLVDLSGGGNVLLMGDLNVREDERTCSSSPTCSGALPRAASARLSSKAVPSDASVGVKMARSAHASSMKPTSATSRR